MPIFMYLHASLFIAYVEINYISHSLLYIYLHTLLIVMFDLSIDD
jgi:hypothetical protein